MEDDYKSNSYKSKDNEPEKEKKIERVVKHEVTTKKKSRFAESLIAEDAKNVGGYILFDVIIPAIKDTISSIVTNGIDMLLFGSGDNGPRRSSNRKPSGSTVSYSSYYNKPKPSSSYPHISGGSERYNYDELVFDNRGEAKDVLYHMQDILEEYKMVSVSDMYELVGVPTSFTDNKYGWDNLDGADVIRLRNGQYQLKLPKIKALD